MGTLSLALTGFSTSLPGAYVETRFAQGEVLGDTTVKKVLFIGVKTSSGTATPDTTVYELGSENDAITYFGTGSSVHRMVRRFLQKCKSAKMYGICATEATGTPATDTVTFSGTASGAGVVTYTVCGETITVPVANTDTADTIGGNFANAVNLRTWLPVTATNTTGTVAINARVDGYNGNHIRHRATITSGITTTCTVAHATLASGATDEVYTTVLTTIAATRYHYILPGVNPTGTTDTRIGAILTQLTSQALPTTGIRQVCIFGANATPSNAVTLAAASGGNGPANNARFQLINQENSEWEPMEIAAYWAGCRFNEEAGSGQAWVNYDSYGVRPNDVFDVPKPYLGADYPTAAEQNSMVVGGVTPIAVDSAGRCYVVQSVTCSTDVRVRDTAKVTVADHYADDLLVRYGSKWTACGVGDDPANSNDPIPAGLATPNRVKTLTIAPLYIDYTKKEPVPWLDPTITLRATTGDIAACTVGIDPVVNTRINARCPLHVTALCHQFAALVTENSSG